MRPETAEAAVIAQELVSEGVNLLVVPRDVDPAVAAGQIAAAANTPALSPAPDVIMTSDYESDFLASIRALRAAGITTPVLSSNGSVH